MEGNREVNTYPCHLRSAKTRFHQFPHARLGPVRTQSWVLFGLFCEMFIFICFSFAPPLLIPPLSLSFAKPARKKRGSFDVIGPDTTVFAIIEGDY